MNGTSIGHFSSSLIIYLLDPAVRAIALAFFVALILRLWRASSAAFRLRLWRVVLFFALALPLLGWVVPSVRLRLPWPQTHIPVHTSAAPHVGNAGKAVALSLPGANRGRSIPLRPALRPREIVSWPVLVAFIYLCAAVFLVVRFSLGLFLRRRLRVASRPIRDPRTIATFERLARVMGVSRVPALAESEAVCVPATMGTRRPLILLPQTWHQWEQQKMSAVLAHELSHVARNDCLIQTLSALYRCLFWFSPLSWWLHSQLTELSEHASDESALFILEDRAYYAEVVMSFLNSVRRAAGRIRIQAVSMASCGHASRRIDRILNGRIGLLPAIGRRGWFGFTLLVSPVVVLTAAVRPTIREHMVTAADEDTPALSAIRRTAPPPGPFLALSASAAQRTTTPPTRPTPGAKLEGTAPPKPGSAKISEDQQGDEPWLIVSGEPNQILIDATKAREPDLHRVIFEHVPKPADESDVQHGEALRSRIKDGYIWFRHEGKPYIIRDAGTVKSALELFIPPQALLDRLEKHALELAKQQAELKELELHATAPDLTPELKKVETQLKALRRGSNQEQLVEAQAALSELQSRLGELQSKSGVQLSELRAQLARLDAKRAELAALGQEPPMELKRAEQSLKLLLDRALATGLAQPE